MQNISGGNAKEQLCGGSCSLRAGAEDPGTPRAGYCEVPSGLSPWRRRQVLASSEPLLADLSLSLDLLEEAVLVLHESGWIIHSNHAVATLALPTKTDAMSSLYALGPGEPWAGCRKILREFRTSAGALEQQVHDPGTGKYWALRISALAYMGVVPRRLVLVIRDISEEVNGRQRLREAEVMASTGALLAGATHQVKNAIFGLSATLDAFEARIKNNAPEGDCIANLRLGIARMQTLMRDLLDYGNPTAGELGAVSMAAVTRRSLNGCQSLAAKMGVGFTQDLAEDVEVVANPARLVRALENVVENALQHSPPAGRVTVRLSSTGVNEPKLLRCDVIDQGPGFPPEHMERLFTPFFTLRAGGTGLGLTIAKKIVNDIGGTIRLSNGRCGGAQVTIFLPVASELRNALSECDCVEK